MNTLSKAFKTVTAVFVLSLLSFGTMAPLALADGCAKCGKASCEGKCACSGGANCGSCKGA